MPIVYFALLRKVTNLNMVHNWSRNMLLKCQCRKYTLRKPLSCVWLYIVYIYNSTQYNRHVSRESRFFWFKMVIGGGLLWTRQWNCDLYITWDRSELFAEINVSRMTPPRGINKLLHERTCFRHETSEHACPSISFYCGPQLIFWTPRLI